MVRDADVEGSVASARDEAGDEAEFFGPTVDLDDFAARSGTIGYNVLTALGARYARQRLDPPEPPSPR